MNPIEALKMHGVGVGKKLVGDAQSGDVRAGKTFSNAQGNDKEGTMPVRSLTAQTIMPGVNNIIKQAGIYDGDITVQGDTNLVGVNILSGKTIFGVAGTFSGKKFASGTVTVTNVKTVSVSGIGFTPATILIENTNDAGFALRRKTYMSARSAALNQMSVRDTGTTMYNTGAWTVGNGTFSTDLYESAFTAITNVSWIAFE